MAEAKAGKDTVTTAAEMTTTTIVVAGGGDIRKSVEKRVGNAESRMVAEEMIAETARGASRMTLIIGCDVVLQTAVVVETMIAIAIAIIADRDTGAVVEVLLLVVAVAVAVVAVGPEVPRDLDCISFSSQPLTDAFHKRERKTDN